MLSPHHYTHDQAYVTSFTSFLFESCLRAAKLQLPRGARVLCFAVRDDEQQKACFALLKG